MLKTSRSSRLYRSIKDDSVIEQTLLHMVDKHPREGFWKYYDRLNNTGQHINHKPLHRVYTNLKLNIRRKAKRRLPERVKESLEVPTAFCKTWSMDFIHDSLTNKRNFRSFNIMDDYNREILFIETDYSIKSSRVIWVLRHLFNRHGKPEKIRMDNGPEFIANLTQQFSEMNGIKFQYIEPGEPTQNAYIERFNRTYREQVLDAYLFDTIDEVREISANFQDDYNNHRPHESLGGMSPIQYKNRNCGNEL